LWQVHEMVFPNDPELFIRPKGPAEALERAQERWQGSVCGIYGT
jgi:hypothetical protein